MPTAHVVMVYGVFVRTIEVCAETPEEARAQAIAGEGLLITNDVRPLSTIYLGATGRPTEEFKKWPS